jgi:hypothetical protein
LQREIQVGAKSAISPDLEWVLKVVTLDLEGQIERMKSTPTAPKIEDIESIRSRN